MKIQIAIVLIMSAFFFSSCSDSDNKPIYVPTAKEAPVTIYKLGIHPYLNSQKMYASYQPIIDYIENKMGNVNIVLETSKNYAEFNKKLYRGDFDFSLPNPFQTYNALSYGYEVIARMKPDSVFKGIFIARKDAKIKNISQIKGEKVSFPARTALAATMMPLLYLHENGLDVEKDIRQKYVGSQYSSILNVYSSDVIVGATWPPPWELWKKDYPEKAKELEVVWETEPLINNGVICKKDLDRDLVKKMTDLLVTLDATATGKALLEKAGFEGFVRSKNADYSVVADFLEKYDRVIGIPK